MKKLLFAAAMLMFVFHDVTLSCPVCFGDKASAEVEGARWAILFLLGVTGSVLSAVATFILYLRRRARLNLSGNDPNHLNREF